MFVAIVYLVVVYVELLLFVFVVAVIVVCGCYFDVAAVCCCRNCFRFKHSPSKTVAMHLLSRIRKPQSLSRRPQANIVGA